MEVNGVHSEYEQGKSRSLKKKLKKPAPFCEARNNHRRKGEGETGQSFIFAEARLVVTRLD